MANVITGHPMVLDTVSATALTTRTFTVFMVRWVAPSASAGTLATVSNAAGTVLWASVASGANYVEESHYETKPLIFEGLTIPTLGTGTVYLYLTSAVPA